MDVGSKWFQSGSSFFGTGNRVNKMLIGVWVASLGPGSKVPKKIDPTLILYFGTLFLIFLLRLNFFLELWNQGVLS